MTDPRIRARRVEVQRAAGRRRFRIALASLAVPVLVTGALLLLHSQLLAAKHVRVVGAADVPRSEVLAAAGLTGHPPLIDVNTGAAVRRLEEIPLVRTASVSLQWPTGVDITLTERTAIAALPATAGFALVDSTGRVLSVAATVPPGVLQVTSVPAAGPPGSEIPAGDLPLVGIAAGVDVSLQPDIKAIGKDTEGDVILELTSGPVADLGDGSQLHQKLVSLATLLQKADLGHVSTIDLRVATAPVLTTTGAGPTLSVIPGG